MPNDLIGGTGAVQSNETGTTQRSSLQRKHPVHWPMHERPNLPIIIFLTVCTKDRKKILTASDAHAVLISAWKEAKSWQVGRYVIMPNHIHLFCAPADLHPKPLLQWVSFWKSRSAQHWPGLTTGPFGKDTSGVRNCAVVKATIRSGIMLCRTRCARVWLGEQRIGPIKAN